MSGPESLFWLTYPLGGLASVGLILVALRRRAGWFVLTVAQLGLLGYTFSTGQYGFVPLNAIGLGTAIVASRSRRWRE